MKDSIIVFSEPKQGTLACTSLHLIYPESVLIVRFSISGLPIILLLADEILANDAIIPGGAIILMKDPFAPMLETVGEKADVAEDTSPEIILPIPPPEIAPVIADPIPPI